MRWSVISLHISIFMCNHIITVGDGGGGGGVGWGANGLNPGKTPDLPFVVNPLLAPWWGYLCQAHLKGGGGA